MCVGVYNGMSVDGAVVRIGVYVRICGFVPVCLRVSVYVVMYGCVWVGTFVCICMCCYVLTCRYVCLCVC